MSACISRAGEYSDHIVDESHTCTRCFVLDEDRLVAEVKRLRKFEADYLEMTSSLGFGDDRTEPAATPKDLREWFSRDMAEARDHRECPVVCEHCGEWLAKEWCPECNGCGMRPSSNEHQYGECEYCAGDLKVHEGCVQRSYADLAADAATLRQLTDPSDAVVEAMAKAAHDNLSMYSWRDESSWSQEKWRGIARASLDAGVAAALASARGDGTGVGGEGT